MLDATRLLLAEDTPYSLRSLACRAVIARGGEADAAALLERMCVRPTDDIGRALMALGTRATGERLLRTFVAEGRLREDVPEVILHALGYLGVEEAEPILWDAARVRDHYLHQSAVLGLVHLPCAGRKAAIADAIRGCHGHNLFNEFVPALAFKVGDPGLLDPLFARGAPTSTDCFGGVLLGLALLGARPTFERILFDPRWEATDGSTGNRRWCWAGFRILGLSILERHRAHRDPDDLDVLSALVSMHATAPSFLGLRPALPPRDDALDLYHELSHGTLRDAARAHRERLGDGPATRLDEARAVLGERLFHRLTGLTATP